MTIDPRESGAMHFFVTEALGIMLEDAFQAGYYYFSGKQRQSQVPTWHKVVGFVWLAVFQVWASPMWLYAQVRHMRFGVDVLFPFLAVSGGSKR